MIQSRVLICYSVVYRVQVVKWKAIIWESFVRFHFERVLDDWFDVIPWTQEYSQYQTWRESTYCVRMQISDWLEKLYYLFEYSIINDEGWVGLGTRCMWVMPELWSRKSAQMRMHTFCLHRHNVWVCIAKLMNTNDVSSNTVSPEVGPYSAPILIHLITSPESANQVQGTLH